MTPKSLKRKLLLIHQVLVSIQTRFFQMVSGRRPRDNYNQIHFGIPNVEQLENRYQNKSTVVIGSGHSAINALLDLATLQQKFADTKIYWVLRKKQIHEGYGGQENDSLAARGELGIRIQQLVESGQINNLTPFHINGVYGQR
ncbi:hypothetical protein [Peribacillus frigoritolerans]|uniref:hypothetical protein n=1 Tax=Peribacillus frigoritolerans TaxID=450367 RepID=UPI0021AA0B0A|nr:hypothetical protein [Peribacillus frigoritolerans]